MFQDKFIYLIDNMQSSTFYLGSAILIGLVGCYLAYAIGKWAEGYLASTKVNQTMKRMGFEERLASVYPKGTITRVFGKGVELWVLLFIAMVCFKILGLDELSQLLYQVVMYFIRIFVAFFIFVVSVTVVDFSQRVIIPNAEKERFPYTHFLSKLISGTIWTLAVLAILYELDIIAPLILAVFVGIIITISISIGVAFGLGGKDMAAKILKEVEEKLK